MARIQAAIQLDPQLAPEQLAFLSERVTVLRQAGGQYWVSMEDNQVDTLIAQGMGVYPQPDGDLVELPAVQMRPAAEPPEPPAGLRAEEPMGDAEGYYLVQFRAPIDKGWLNEIAGVGGEFVQAVPNQMQFAPKELRVKAGAKVRLVFENPDLMIHNLLLLAPGSLDEIGALADQMAATPDGLAQGYIPKSPKVLHATKLVQHKQSAELQFDAPAAPGKYPFVCTFPGHWRIMRGELIVE